MNGKTIFTCMQHGMLQCFIVLAVSGTLKTSNFGTFSGIAHLP